MPELSHTMMYTHSRIRCGFAALLFLCSAGAKAATTGPDVRYHPDRNNARTVVLENDAASYTLDLDRGVKLVRLLEKKSGADLMEGNPPLLFVSARVPGSFQDVGYDILTLEESRSGQTITVTVSQRATSVENPLVVTQAFSLGDGPGLHWTADVRNGSEAGRDYREAQTLTSRIRFPVMQDIAVGPPADRHYLIPTQGSFYCIDSPDDFVFYFTHASDPKMPIDIYNDATGNGVYFHVLSSPLIGSFTDKDDYVSRIFPLRQEPGEATRVMDARIVPHEGDWHAAFWAFKEYIRSNFDFTYYGRPVQESYRRRFVSHFTFLYGKDIYDFERNRFRIDEFLDEGEVNFGGYDYMLLWHDYPRMGIDDRDQFAMYEDLPGGLEGLRRMVDRAHARGVQVFIPYKPWDIMRKGQNHFTEEARIAQAIGADGVFLDTMSESDIAFREALDAVNPDNVFVSEGRPTLEAAQLVTGSWNQQGNATNKMPNVDLFRFVIPEHNVHNINRSARERRELILNALFNGTGFIVWEDIFGEINAYTWDERIMIHRYSRIIHENSDAYLTDHPIPLVPALHPDLYVNAFPVADKAVYPAFVLRRAEIGLANHGRMDPRRVVGPFLEVDHPADWHYVDVWNHQPILTRQVDGRTQLIMPEELADDVACIVGMPKNLTVDRAGNRLRIRVTRPLQGAFIQVSTVDNLTMMEEPRSRLPGSGGTVNVSDLALDFPYKVLVKLVQDGVLKDQVIMDLGWKQFDVDSY